MASSSKHEGFFSRDYGQTLPAEDWKNGGLGGILQTPVATQKATPGQVPQAGRLARQEHSSLFPRDVFARQASCRPVE